MKKLVFELITKYFSSILENWVNKIYPFLKEKLTLEQTKTFIENTLNILLEVINTSDFSKADQYLIDSYNLFSKANLNLLDISQLFSQGRYAVINLIDKDALKTHDPVILLGFVDELVEGLFARYGMLHQKAQMSELEIDRDRLADKLELNQQYLKNILHTSDSAIMMVDNNETFIAWNKGAERIFGYTEEEVIGQPSTLLLPDEQKYRNELKKIQEDVQLGGITKILETERKTKDGKILSVRLSVSKLPAKDESYAGRTIIIKDYTEVKKLQEQIDQSEKLAVIGQLAAGVAHEIGNPLTSISSLVQLLQRKSKDEFYIEQLAIIKENIDRINKIVRELVDFSRPPSYEFELIEISDIIRTAIGIVKYDKRVRKVNFETKLAPQLPKANIVADQLLQVFVNILINALDAIEGNGQIDISSSYDNTNIIVEIIDNGCGMDETVLSKIFDPFFTTKEVGKGTGLGLAVSYGIIKRFKGDIKVASKLNEGSSFTIIIPAAEKID